MEIDRVTQMGGVGREAVPVWTKSGRRRRRFSENDSAPEHHDEDAPADESQDAEGAAEPDTADFDPEDPHSGMLDVMA